MQYYELKQCDVFIYLTYIVFMYAKVFLLFLSLLTDVITQIERQYRFK